MKALCLLVLVLVTGRVRAQERPLSGLDLNTMLQLFLKLRDAMPFDFSSSANVSADCSASFEIWIKSLLGMKMWALEMLDANARIPSGFLQGGFPMFGSFDQCLKISVDPSEWSNLTLEQTYNDTILGQYCTVNLEKVEAKGDKAGGLTEFYPVLNPVLIGLKGVATMFLRYDACLPNRCSLDDVNRFFRHHLKAEKVGMRPVVRTCQSDQPKEFRKSQITAIVVLSILGLFIFCGTTLDIGQRLCTHFIKKNVGDSPTRHRGIQTLLAFSAYSNGLKLLDTRQSADSLSAVNGIRFLSMTWVILGHCYAFLNISILGNIFVMMDLSNNLPLQAVFNGFLSVDTFFFLSGVLVAYVTIRELRKGGRLNLGFFSMFFFHRFWRLTPAVILTILLVFVWPLLFTGPTAPERTAPHFFPCEDNWWLNVLYIQNLFTRPICLGHSWFLANDMQFYVLSPIILVSLYMNQYVGLAVNSLFLLATFITSGVLGHIYSLPPALLIADLTSTNDFMIINYVKPWCRMGPFCIGIFIGYFLALKRTYRLPLVVQIVCWCVAIVCNVSVLYAVYPWNSGTVPERWVALLYLSVSRTVWAIGLGWLTFACATNQGGIVNRFLSWKAFIPLGRMTYMAYLIHPYIQYTFSAVLRERIIYTHYLYVILFLGMLVISYGFAFALSLAFEAPFLALEKIMFTKPDQKVSSNTQKARKEDLVATTMKPVASSVPTHEFQNGNDNPAFDPDTSVNKLTEL